MGSFASVNGEIVPLHEARVPVLDNGFVFGDSVYEVLRTYNGRPFQSGRHFRRMRASADRLGIPVPATDGELLDQVRALLARADHVESYVRIVVSRGVGNSSYDFDTVVGPTVVMIQKELTPVSERQYEEGIRVCAVAVRRNHPRSLDPVIKSSNLLNNILAVREAKARGAEEAVLLNHEGHIAEGASTNVFVVNQGALRTPPLSAGILGGITREIVLELSPTLGVASREEMLTMDDLLGADEAFLSSTTREILPVRQVDESLIADGRPGPVTRKVMAAFREFALAHCD
ncbi:MAG: aminotransferase class IV [Acidobacteria bacterium]|jgi:branched-chain amino acid aminotransferase|nr:aminotransferase class IV [Acidobacteriota bacterium]